MEDLAVNPVSGALLTRRLASAGPLALLCHAPAAALSPPDPDGSWPFKGYKMTGLSNADLQAGAALRVSRGSGRRALADCLGSAPGDFERLLLLVGRQVAGDHADIGLCRQLSFCWTAPALAGDMTVLRPLSGLGCRSTSRSAPSAFTRSVTRRPSHRGARGVRPASASDTKWVRRRMQDSLSPRPEVFAS